MTIENTGVVDIIADDADEGVAALVIADHLEWGDAQPDHLLLLQEKINTYIRFVESEEVYEGRPNMRNRRLIVKVVGLYPLNAEAQEFYLRATEVLEGIGLTLVFELDEHALDE